jgi:hypothetical protein
MEIKNIDHSGPRVETGPVQFGHDWPGVFIRGDNALHHAYQLSILLNDKLGAEMAKVTLAGLARLLASCDARTQHPEASHDQDNA